jgi:hypothetical protein
MEEFGIPRKLIELVQMTMAKVECSVRIQTHLSESLNVKNGLRQDDALACLLFNIFLEKVVCESNIQTRGTIFSKTTRILAYAVDTDIMSRTMLDLKESFISFEKSSRKMRLVINQEKMLYMYSGRKENPPNYCLWVNMSSVELIMSSILVLTSTEKIQNGGNKNTFNYG